jgi:hypothetical protein
MRGEGERLAGREIPYNQGFFGCERRGEQKEEQIQIWREKAQTIEGRT